MSYPINYPTPQGANVQIFYSGGVNGKYTTKDWIKPQGASFVWFTLIGAGGGGDGTVGGGSGGVTNFMGPAFLIPDVLQINVGTGVVGDSGTETTVVYQQKAGTGYTLLRANPGNVGGSGGGADSSNYFSCMGFYQTIAGQGGTTVASSASSTTFLSGGGAANPTVANYGYQSADSGIFQMQPIIVGTGGTNRSASHGGIGCGGGFQANTKGGDGLVVIITW